MRVVLAAAAALIFGASGGFLIGRSVQPKIDLEDEFISCEVGNAGMRLITLRAIRSGRHDDAVQLLEAELSLHAVSLDELIRLLEPKDASTPEKLIRSIALYRSEHPYSSGLPEADQNVESILASY